MIKYGICESSIIPVRKEPNDRSEMINQLLFGETFQVLEETIKWTFVKLSLDDYTGWIDNKEITFLTSEEFQLYNTNKNLITNKLFTKVFNHNNQIVFLPAGSTLPNFNPEDNQFSILNKKFKLIDDQFAEPKYDTIAKQFLNAPYLWGGKNPFGIDCSGFTQVFFRIFGENIPRDANKQVKIGKNIDFISDTKTGDLAFFDDSEGNIIHVGIVLENNEIIHASGKVRMDIIDQQGINNTDLKKYTYKLRVIKRILN